MASISKVQGKNMSSQIKKLAVSHKVLWCHCKALYDTKTINITVIND
jgi:hypothetical protein